MLILKNLFFSPQISECEELQETLTSLNKQLAQALNTKNSCLSNAKSQHLHVDEGNTQSRDVTAELLLQAHMVSSVNFLHILI